MANVIKVKQSAVPGKVPTTAQLELGELAVNTVDGKLYTKISVSGTESIADLTGGVSGGGVSSVSGTAPIASSGGTTPAISIQEASASVDGYLSSTDWSTFNSKQDSLTVPSGAIVGTTDVQTLSGKTLTGTKETRVEVPASAIDLDSGNYFTKTVSGILTWTVSNVPSSGTVASIILDLTNGGTAAQTWWSGVKWAGGSAPTLTAAGRDTLGFFTHDGGTTWSGLVLGKDVK